MTKHIAFALAVLAMAPAASAQQAPAAGTTTSGSISTGVQPVDSSTNSSKLTEYRDLRDEPFVPSLGLNLFNAGRGLFLDLAGRNLARRDQSLSAAIGRPNTWSLRADWSEIPHNFSNKARTPYIQRTAGLLEVPASVPVTFKKLATGGSDTAGVVGTDALVAAYQAEYLRPTELAVQSRFARAAFEAAPADGLRLGLAYDSVRKDGLKSAFGPIGDRPPRTLNVQLTEPVDYRTNDVTLSAEHVGRNYVAQFTYLFSDFANRVDTLTWENLWATAVPGATYDVWDRAVSAYGRRPLSPDNRYHNASVSLAGDLPGDSRLSATVAYGRMDQDSALLPYSYNSDILVNATLPRTSAQAEINTTQALVDYVVNPMTRLNVRAWARYYGMDNNTPEDHWQYVTSDTANLNGTVTFLNKRVNAPYATDRMHAGVEATYRLPARSTLGVGYERESFSREHREADTAEDRLTLSLRTRAARWANLRARYILGSRNGDEYHGNFTREGYWYERAEAGSDNNNPRFTFDNHPDMRRFDVIDRMRNQLDLTLNLTPTDVFTISGSVRYRSDDFDAGVTSVRPLDAGVGDPNAATPGQQLGLLEDSRVLYSVDVFYMPSPRVTFNAFFNRDAGNNLQRGLEFNENNKANPATVATAELGPWTRASSQWTADTDDSTRTFGLGGTFGLIPDRLTAALTYSATLADVDIEYGGFGVTNWDGTPFPANHQFAFSTPPRINEDLHVFDLRFDVPIVRAATFTFGYTFEKFTLDDWQQSASQAWVEPVGSEFLLRDTSRSFQWGNRLFNLGTPLAPSYKAHIGYAALTYRF
jgi:MtrB/PioB family decaheme-associated outer membrane protein